MNLITILYLRLCCAPSTMTSSFIYVPDERTALKLASEGSKVARVHCRSIPYDVRAGWLHSTSYLYLVNIAAPLRKFMQNLILEPQHSAFVAILDRYNNPEDQELERVAHFLANLTYQLRPLTKEEIELLAERIPKAYMWRPRIMTDTFNIELLMRGRT